MIAELIPLDAYRDIEAEMGSVIERESVRDGSSQQQRRVDARVVWADQIGTSFLEVNWLAKGLIEVGSLALIYGPPKSGKTFIATDLALHIATGREWMGCRVRSGGLVVYVSHEGTPGVMRRILAHARHHDLEMNTLTRLAVVRFSLNLLDRKCIADFVAFIRQIESERGERVSLIVIDTLAPIPCGAPREQRCC
ncbi:MAG: AAA family ATPase [Alphaproteobacteria bacterium]|nr:AAA family ATPase [Alphaproteobacteria bacterium]